MKKLLLTGFALVSMAAQAQNSWVPQATNFPTVSFAVDEIDIVDANTVWTFAYDGRPTSQGGGTYPKVISRTVNGGTTWTATTVSGPGANALISDLSAVDANTAWIVTAPSATGGTNANRIWKTTNGGTSWAQQTSGYSSSSFGNQIYFWDANEGWTAGDPVGGLFEMYRTTNGGTTWTAVAGRPAPLGAEYSYVGLKEVVNNTIWMGTDIGRILRSSDKGQNWSAFPSPALDFGGVTTCGSSGSFAFKDENNGILIAVDGAGQQVGTVCNPTLENAAAMMYSTTNGGATWEPVESTGTFYFGDIAYVPGTANTYVTTGINPTAGFMGSAYSTDGGLTWVSIDAGDQRGKVAFFNSTTGWAGDFGDGPAGTTGILKFSGDLNLAVSDNAVKSSLKISPNPASDVVTVTANKEIKSVSIIDLSGKKVKSEVTSSKVNVSSLAKGTYILQVNYGNGTVENTKLIKK